jgi:hypothetical protein
MPRLRVLQAQANSLRRMGCCTPSKLN